MRVMKSILEGWKGKEVTLCELPSGYRVSTRVDGDRFNIWDVMDDSLLLQSDTLRLRKLVSLSYIVELEIELSAEQGDIKSSQQELAT